MVNISLEYVYAGCKDIKKKPIKGWSPRGWSPLNQLQIIPLHFFPAFL
jgi:hypothetical protein